MFPNKVWKAVLILVFTPTLIFADSYSESFNQYVQGEEVRLAPNFNASLPSHDGAIVRRQDDQTFHLCRAIDGARKPAPGLKAVRNQESLARPSDFEHAKQLAKRMGPVSARNLPRYIVSRVGKGADNSRLTRVYGEQTWQPSSIIVDLTTTTEEIDIGAEGLCGCTMLWVVSQEAVYSAHYFEDFCFSQTPPDNDETKEPPPIMDFERWVEAFLEEGIANTRGEGPWKDTPPRYQSLRLHAEDFKTNRRAFILTPTLQNEQDEYIRGRAQYSDKVFRLKDAVQDIFLDIFDAPVINVEIQTYDALDQATQGNILDTQPKGMTLYQFDPHHSSTRGGNQWDLKKARLFLEDREVYVESWPKPPVQALGLFALPKTDELKQCGGQYYTERNYTCYGTTLCPVINGIRTLRCGPDCYLESEYFCDGFQIMQVSVSSSNSEITPAGTSSLEPTNPPTGSQISTSLSTSSPSSSTVPHTTQIDEEVIYNGTTYTIGTQSQTVTREGGQLVTLGPGTILIGTQTIFIPTVTGSTVLTTGGITLTLQPRPPPITSTPLPTVSAVCQGKETACGPICCAVGEICWEIGQCAVISSSSRTQTDSTTRLPPAVCGGGEPSCGSICCAANQVCQEPGQCVAKPSSTTQTTSTTQPPAICGSGQSSCGPICCATSQVCQGVGQCVARPSTATQIVIGGSTYTLGGTSSTISADGTTYILGPGGVVIGTKTISFPTTRTGTLIETITTDGLTFTLLPPATSSTPISSSQLPPTVSGSTAPAPGSTGTNGLPTSTSTEPSPDSTSVETLTASDGQSTIQVTFIATTLTQFSGVSGTTTLTTSIDGRPTTIILGPGGVVWGCPDCTSTRTGFPSISFPTLPPAPGSTISVSRPSTSTSFGFPSTQFPIPPIITTTSTSQGPNGPVLITITGTTNSGGVVIPIVTIQPAGAISSAIGLAGDIRSLSGIVMSFSSNTANSAAAATASAAVHEANEDSNDFGRDLAIVLGALCLLFCSTVSAVASTLATLEATITGIIAGGGGLAALAGLLATLGALADSLLEEAEEERDSTSKETETSTRSSSSSSTCTRSVITDCSVVCSTGSVASGQITSCFSSSCQPRTISACSATATTSTSFEGGPACPLTAPPSGPVSILQYPGFVQLPLGSDIDPIVFDDTTTSISSFTSTTFRTSTTSSTVVPCGQPRSCELNNCDGVYEDGQATCQNAFNGCTCLPSSATPGFCGQARSCQLNNCAGTVIEGVATCKRAFEGCKCLPDSNTPGFCGNKLSCQLNDCRGEVDDGVATCKGNFAGCECNPDSSTPGFCGTKRSCELNSCGGTVVNGFASCKKNFAGCECLPSSDTEGFCGRPLSCELNGCAGTTTSSSAVATCKENFKGCTCIASSNTPGFCGPLGSCDFVGCQGTTSAGGGFGVCKATGHEGCGCIASANTPGFCRTRANCDLSTCQGGSSCGTNAAFGHCSVTNQKDCLCDCTQRPPSDPPTQPQQPCDRDCLDMLTDKINGLPDQICTGDDSNNWVDFHWGDNDFVDWWRLASHNNCYIVLAKQSHTKGFPNEYCFQKSAVQAWIRNNALGCNAGDNFFRPSVPVSGGPLVGLGMMCLSNFLNYQKCGSSNLNGGTVF